MKKTLPFALIITLLSGWHITFAQCTINEANTHTGFSPTTPAVIQPGVLYSQSVQVHVPGTYSLYTVDSLHIDSITGMPSGITYILNPTSGTVLGDSNGVICFSGTTNDTVGPYPLTFWGNAYTNVGPIPFSYLTSLQPSFGYKFRVETAPVAAFVVDSPICTIADSVRFTDMTQGYPTGWAWQFPGGSPATSTKQFPVVYYDSAGTYTATLAARNGISSDTITQTFTVYPAVSGSVSTTTAIGDSSATGGASVNAIGGTMPYQYAWSNGATTDTITNVIEGAYSVTITDAKGCQYIDDTINISFVNGILQLSAVQQLKIYPNPAADVLNLVWSQKSNADVAIIDLNGTLIRSYISYGSTLDVYNVHELAAGTYLIRVTDKTSNKQQSLLFSKF